MSKVKRKTLLGNREVINIEVQSLTDPEDHSFVDCQNIVHHNCNGPHAQLVVVDEIDTVSGEGLKAFREITGMLDSRGDQKALRVGISTRKSRYGLMNRQIEEAEKAGRTVRRWTAFEFHERCPDERSGTAPTDLYVFQDKMEVISPEEWAAKDRQRQSEYIPHTYPGEKCLSCPIAAICYGDAKKQTSASPMLKPIGELVKKAIENDSDWALSQLMNLKPSVEGIVFKEFDERLHVKTWDQMWTILTGTTYPGECTHDIFVRKCHSMGLSAYSGIDWGWSNPSTLVVFFVDKRENIYVVRCEGRTFTNNPTWAQTIKNKWHHMYRVQLYFPDLANPGDAVTMRAEGLPCPSLIEKDTPSGIQVIKRMLKSLASPVPKLYFASETCQPIIQEMQLYHFKTDAAGRISDDVEKEHDHYIDALRYGIYSLFGKPAAVLVDSEVNVREKLVDQYGSFSRMPSAEEFAATRNMTVRRPEDIDTRNLGKRGKMSDIVADDEDNVGGDGNFLWSF